MRTKYNFAQLDQEIFKTLKNLDYHPEVIFDVGASNGYWSYLIHEIVPDATYHLFEPLVDHIPTYTSIMESNLEKCPNFTLHKYGLGEKSEEKIMSIFSEGFGSTLLAMDENQDLKKISVPILTMDEAIKQFNLPQPQVIKADIQGFELAMLKGATATLPKTDVLLLEAWVYRGYTQECALLLEIMNWLAKFNFYLWDYGDCFREDNGKLQTIDCVFVNGKTLPSLAPLSSYEPKRDESIQNLEAELESYKSELARYQSENLNLAEEIVAMKSSKFWKLRRQWFKLKRWLGLKVS
ncbi:FkbM family methyltransferase [Crocosphaera sp. Alani8]|uniref:FkbM family methyltransferase n=1 Tax=Crocosphaera sp. Alani8 TaxID=3038952 RepID=UPI00313DD9B4